MVAIKGARASSGFFVFVILIFFAFGDRFLPKPIGPLSYKARTAVENFLKGQFPSNGPIDNPHDRTEDAVRTLEGR